MKIALVSQDGAGAWFLLRLMEEGNDCDYYLLSDDPKVQRSLKGLIPSPLNREPKSWRKYDLVLFDVTSDGELADRIRSQTSVIGCSELACRLENDRLFGLNAMKEMGIDVPLYEPFDSPDEARKWLSENPDRYVYKPFQTDGAEELDCSVTYVSHSAADMDGNLDRLFHASKGAPFLLQKFVEGIEVSTEAWFDGSQFHFINGTLEEKKFLAGDHGQNVGCAGNVVFPYQGVPHVFTRGLARGREWLRDHDYRGMIDLNSIVTRSQVWGLEWTPRFGYWATASLTSLIATPLADFLLQFADAPKGGIVVDTKIDFQFGTAIDISVPPFPCPEAKAKSGEPIEGIDPENAWRETALIDVMMDGDSLVTAGIDGHIGAVLGKGHTFRGAWDSSMEAIKKVKAPDLQWRVDLEQSTGKRYRALRELGWI